MVNLRTANTPAEELSAEEILETLLVEADVAGQLPTNEKKLLQTLGLQQLSFDFMREVPFLRDSAPTFGELRAALHMKERVVATQAGMGESRTRFSIFHEIAHCVLPEHFEQLFVDNDQTLGWWTKTRLEREANRFAADLLFQGKLFTEQALSLPTSIQTVLDLAPVFGASYEASLRRFTELHVEPCALIVYQRVPHKDDEYFDEEEYQIHYTVTSSSFRRLFFSSVQLPNGKCKASELFGDDLRWRLSSVVTKEMLIEREGDTPWCFESEVFTNSYKVFQFLKRLIGGVEK